MYLFEVSMIQNKGTRQPRAGQTLLERIEPVQTGLHLDHGRGVQRGVLAAATSFPFSMPARPVPFPVPVPASP